MPAGRLYTVVAPPPLKPCEPSVSAGAAAALLRRHGAEAAAIDASIGWHRWALGPERLAAHLAAARDAGVDDGRLAAQRRAAAGVSAHPTPLRRAATYRDRQVYTSAARELELAVGLAAAASPGYRLGISTLAFEPGTRRVESSAALAEAAGAPTPFDGYFVGELIPALAAAGAGRVGVSLAYQQQCPAAFRLAALLADRLPSVTRVLGGPLVACWRAAGLDLDRPPFDRFHLVWDGTDDGLLRSAGLDPSAPALPAPAERAGPLTGAFDEAPWESYFVPAPTVPAALGRGCPWRRCAFCPDHLHPRHDPCDPATLVSWLREVAARFPTGAMIHLTDSALPPDALALVAETVRAERLPLRWHGFVRVEEALADISFARSLRDGGCALLQLGVESGSPRMLAQLGKGTDPDRARRVLAALGAARVPAQVYLLFGLPGETDEDREATLDLVARHEAAVTAVNAALLNLPVGSPMHRRPERFGITEIVPFHRDTDLSLSVDFRCGASHPRLEARRWLERRFFKHPALRRIAGHLRTPFKANHLCFLAP